VIEGFASQDEVTALRNRADALVEKFDPATISIFSTRNQTADEYFLDSSNNISFFFEEKAFDEEGKLRQAKALSINKIGHAMHDLDPVFRAFSRSPRVSAVMKSLGYKRPLPVQSMYIFKASLTATLSPEQQPVSCTHRPGLVLQQHKRLHICICQ